jgi:hypothetical protein
MIASGLAECVNLKKRSAQWTVVFSGEGQVAFKKGLLGNSELKIELGGKGIHVKSARIGRLGWRTPVDDVGWATRING